MITRPPKHGGHARRRWQTRTTAEPNNVVDLPAIKRRIQQAYWDGVADTLERLKGTGNGGAW